MMKRFLAMLLAVLMVVSVLPAGVLAEGSGTPVAQAEHTHKVCNGSDLCADCTHTDVTYEPWENATSLPKSGNYYLTCDVTLGAQVDMNVNNAVLNLCLNGHTISIKDGVSTRHFYLRNAGTMLTITNCNTEKDGILTGGKASSIMNAYDKSVTVELYNVVMQGNSYASAGGGAIMMQGATTLKLVGCKLLENSASVGGAIRNHRAKSSVTLIGCEIKNNTAKAISAIRVDNASTVTLIDTIVEGNKTTETGDASHGAVYLYNAGANLVLEGKTQITGNLDGADKAADLFLQMNDDNTKPLFSVSTKGLDKDARIGILLGDSRLAADGGLTVSKALSGATVAANNFLADNENYKAKIENDTVVLVKDEGHIHKVCNGDTACPDCAHTNVTYLPWGEGEGETTKLPTSGNYYLTADVTLSAQTDLSGTTLNLCLNGHTIKTAQNVSVRHFMLANNAQLTISNCSTTEAMLTGGKASSIMTNSNAQNASVIELYNITLKGNTYTGGGAVMLQGKSNLKAVSCKFNENTGTSSAGAIRLYGTGNAVLIGCEVKGNTAPTMSAIYLQNGTLTLIDTVIEGNTATKTGDATYGAVYMTNSDTRTLTVAGATRITGNTDADGKAYNVFFQNSAGKQGVLTIGEEGLSGNALIGISLQAARLTAADGMTVTKKLNGANPIAHISSDNETYMPILKDDTVVLGSVEANTHRHKICADSTCTDHADMIFQPWDSKDSLPATGSYYLTEDVTLSAQCKPTDTLNLCLNGHTVTVKEGSGARHFYVEYAANLNITNCNTAKEGILTGGQASSIMTSGDATKGSTGQVNLYNIVLEGNTYSGGGAIMLQGKTVLTAVGCQIRNNTATGGGGAMRIYSGNNKATFIGCQIKNNTAASMSAIRLDGGTLTLTDTVIEGNTNTTAGDNCYGALYTPNNSGKAIIVNGATRITGNTDKDGKEYNVLFQNAEGKQAVITVGEKGLSGDALIGITMRSDRLTAADGRAVTAKLNGADVAKYFSSNCEGFEIALKDDVLVLAEEITHIHKLCNDSACVEHTDVQFANWTDGKKLPASGSYCLQTDVQLSSVITVKGELNLCLNGHKITAKANERHFAVDGQVNITDCQGGGQITGGKRAFGGAVASVNAGGTFNLYSGELTGNQAVKNANGASYGGAIFLYAADGDKPAAAFNMYGGKITGNSSEAEGGAIYARAGATINILGGEISGNTAGTQGGAIYFAGAKLVAKDCLISGNSASSGGAIRAAGDGVLELTNCKVVDNTVSGIASAIRMEGGSCTLKLTDTIIEGNKSTGSAGMNTYGAVFAPNNAYTIILEGQTRITGNTDKNGDPADTYFQHTSGKQAVITVSDKGLSGDAKIGIAVWTTRLAAGDNMVSANAVAEGQEGYFDATVPGYTVARGEDGKLYLIDGHDSHNVCGEADCKDHENLIWLPWNDAKTLPASGNYYLNTDVQLKAVRVLNSKDLNLCLNGHTITAPKNERSFVVSEGITLSITDCTETGKITGGVRNFGGVINVNQGATFNLYAGNLTGNTTLAMTNENGKSGAVYVTRAILGYKVGDQVLAEKPEEGVEYEEVVQTPGGVFNMYGGTISENKAFMGGAVFVCDGATFNLYDGTIANNATIGRGGAIVGDGKAVINIHGGTISGNTASKGAGIYVRNGAHIEMTGGVITKNKTNNTFVDDKQIEKASGAAAVSLTNQSTMTMSGGEISYNEGKGAGGAILIESKGTKMILKDGKFVGNTSTSDGGAIYVSTNTEFEMSGGTITKNQSKKNGGGIYFLRSTGKISGGSINGNITTEGFGGGMAMARANVTMSGGSVSYNVSKLSKNPKAGGIMINGSTFNLYGGTIAGNYTVQKGSGNAITTSTSSSTTNGVKTTYYTTINMYGGTISGHEGNYGGAILLQSKTVMNMYGGTFRDNYAPVEGGAVCLYSQSQFHMQGGTMTGNKADSRGGCIKFNAGTSGSFSGGTVTGNYAGQYGGFINAHGIDTKITVKDMKIYGNECRNYGGAIAITWNAQMDMDNCEFYENKGGEGGAMYLAHKTTCYLDNVKVYKNYSTDAGGAFYLDVGNNINFTNVQITENEAVANGGGIYTRANLRLTDCLIDSNVSGKDGGGIATSAAWTYGNDPAHTNGYIGRGQGMIIENTVISNNTCVGRGGAAFMAKKNWNTVINSTFTGNTAGETGSALFVGDDLLVMGMTVTGNTSKTDGYAVYFRENNYDGQSYQQAIHQMGGNVIVKDNVGGDMMLCKDVNLGNIVEGYGEDTCFHVTLSDGLLTNRILGEYNYEGGELNYTVTYGSRSWTDPEVAAPVEEETQPATEETVEATEPAEAGEDNTALYAGIGGIGAVIVLAAIVLVIVKKKKTPAAGKE